MLHALRSTLYGLRFTLARSNKTTVHVFIDKISVRFTHSLCYSYLHFTWGTIFTLCLTMLQYIIVHISTSLLSLKVGVCFKGLQEPEHSLKHKLILLLWMRLWLKEWVDWVLTTVRTRPGFWIRWAFTTWNTSTTLSVLQQSMVVAMARNMPDLQTVSLERLETQDYHVLVVIWLLTCSGPQWVCCQSYAAPCTPPTAAGLRQLMIWWVSLWAVTTSCSGWCCWGSMAHCF